MHLVVVTAPDPVVTLEDAKAHLRRDDGDEDALIEGLVAAATGAIDGPDGWLGRSLGRQSIEARLSDHHHRGWHDFWHVLDGDILLPCGPLVSVDQVSYLDRAGSPQTLDQSGYRVFGIDTVRGQVRLDPALPWSLMAGPESLRVRYTAGYTSIPKPIRAAILMMTARLYAARGELVPANLVEDPAICALLSPFRVFG